MMAKRQSGRGWRRHIATPYAIGLVLLLSLLLAQAVWGAFRKQRLASRERERVAEELAQLAERQKQLEGDIALLQTEPGLERAIREKFLVAQEGERVVALVPGSGPASTSVATSSDDSWWSGWWKRRD